VKVELSRPGKLLFPDDGITKRDLAAYYEGVAELMLPHVRDRPVSMQRFPDGIAGEGFFHKQVPHHYPDWIPRVEVPKRGGSVTHALIRNPATLVYLADQACITPHVWLSRADRLDVPDRMVIDLDPPGDDFGAVRSAARTVRDLLHELGLAPHLMTTGSRGLHLVVPLRRRARFGEVRHFARDVARLLAEREPGRFTVESRKAKRDGRLYLDTGRNAWAQTAVPPYAVRPRRGAPVATPLAWDELSDGRLNARRYHLRNLARRTARKDDPWRGIARRARTLSEPRRRLDHLLDEARAA
jgi:bifunctional non-homologous end joining protein LigD